MWRRFTFLFRIVTMLAGIDAGRTARAQATDRPGQRQPPPRPPALLMADPEFETFIANEPAPVEVIRGRLKRRLAWEIKRIDQIFGLTPEQRKKLNVAGRGDIKRFFERVQEKQKRFDHAKEDVQNAIEFHKAWIELRAMTREIPETLFLDGSIFVKTLKKTLSAEQRKRYEKDQLDFYRSRVEWAVVSGLGALRLSDDQRRRLVTRIVEETRPLRRYGQHDFPAVLIQASRLPEAKLKPIFDEAQWRRLLAGFEDVKRIEEEVVAGGYLPVEKDRPAGKAAHDIREED